MKQRARRFGILGLLFLTNLFFVQAQQTAELGAFVGATNYYGDLNEGKLLRAPSYALGGFFQYNMNKRVGWKTQFSYANIKGEGYFFSSSYDDANNITPYIKDYEFSTNLFDINAEIIYYFLPFDFQTIKKDNFSPYIKGGLGMSIGTSANGGTGLNFPFGLGVKYMVTDKISVGFEFNMKKFFSDKLDQQSDNEIYNKNSLIHNNDWCSFTGIFISCRVFQEKLSCPAYSNK